MSRVYDRFVLFILVTASACNASKEPPHVQTQDVSVAIVQSKDVTIAQQYIGRFRSQRDLKVKAPEAGIVERVLVTAGQEIKDGDLLFRFRPTKGKDLQAAGCENQVEQITASFDGTVGSVKCQKGSDVEQGDILTSIYDNTVMRVYFDVPEGRYLEYMADEQKQKSDLQIELTMSNGDKFDQPGTLGAIEADFQGGRIPFRADFPNPDRQLRHGQVGTISLGRIQHDALVIPQRAMFEMLNQKYVYVIDKNNIAHRREVAIQNEVDDIFVVKEGLVAGEKIVVDGVRRIHEGDKVKYDSPASVNVIADPKHPPG